MHLLNIETAKRRLVPGQRASIADRELRIRLPCLQLQHHASSLHEAGCSFQMVGCTAELQCRLAAAQPLFQEAAGTSKANAARSGAAWAAAVADAGRGTDLDAKVEERALVAAANTWQAQEDALHQNELQQVMASWHTCAQPDSGSATLRTFCSASVNSPDGLRLQRAAMTFPC